MGSSQSICPLLQVPIVRSIPYPYQIPRVNPVFIVNEFFLWVENGLFSSVRSVTDFFRYVYVCFLYDEVDIFKYCMCAVLGVLSAARAGISQST